MVDSSLLTKAEKYAPWLTNNNHGIPWHFFVLETLQSAHALLQANPRLVELLQLAGWRKRHVPLRILGYLRYAQTHGTHPESTQSQSLHQ